MNNLFANEQPAAPGRIPIRVEFVEALPMQLQIKNPMKSAEQKKLLGPTLFHLAASLDQPASSALSKPASVRLPLDDWAFSRERLESALRARITLIKKHSVMAPENRAVKQTKRAAGESRPVQYYPFASINTMAGAV